MKFENREWEVSGCVRTSYGLQHRLSRVGRFCKCNCDGRYWQQSLRAGSSVYVIGLTNSTGAFGYDDGFLVYSESENRGRKKTVGDWGSWQTTKEPAQLVLEMPNCSEELRHKVESVRSQSCWTSGG